VLAKEIEELLDINIYVQEGKDDLKREPTMPELLSMGLANDDVLVFHAESDSQAPEMLEKVLDLMDDLLKDADALDSGDPSLYLEKLEVLIKDSESDKVVGSSLGDAQESFNQTLDNLKKESVIFVDAKTILEDMTQGPGSQEYELWGMMQLSENKSESRANQKVKFIIYGISPVDERLAAYRALKNVEIHTRKLPRVYASLKEDFKRNLIIHISKEGVDPIRELGQTSDAHDRMKFFRYQKDQLGVAPAALYYSEMDGELGDLKDGIREVGGYITLVLDNLLDQLAKAYSASLSIAKAA